MEKRAIAYFNYRRYIAVRAKYFFQMMLGQRGYGGKMAFDHPNEALTVQVGQANYCGGRAAGRV